MFSDSRNRATTIASEQQALQQIEIHNEYLGLLDRITYTLIGSGRVKSEYEIADLVGRGQWQRVKRGPRPFPPAVIGKIVAGIPDKAAANELRELLKGFNARYRYGEWGTVRDLVRRAKEYERNQEQCYRSQANAIFWQSQAAILLRTHGHTAALPRIEDIRSYAPLLIDGPRQKLGEVAALRNAYVLMQAYRVDSGRVPSGVRLARLELIATVVDLAAQLNDYKLLSEMAAELEAMQPHLSDGIERSICGCIRMETRSRAIKYGPNARDRQNMVRATRWMKRALEWEPSRAQIAALANDWPSLLQGWMAPYMSQVGMGIASGSLGWRIDDYISAHDRATMLIPAKDNASTLLSEDVESESLSNIYAGDLATTLMLTKGKLDEAIGFAHALLAANSPGHQSDTARASLLLSICEALLRKYRHDWTPTSRQRYEDAKYQAAAAFGGLGMMGKLARLKSAELEAGLPQFG